MRQPIRSGRAWIPREWRQATGVPPWRRSAIVAVTGVRTRDDAIAVLSGHLPLVPAWPEGAAGDYEEHVGVPAGESRVDDIDGARRVARRLSSVRAGRGVRQLLDAHAIIPGQPAVYAWRRAAPRETAYQLFPDGSTAAIAVFAETQETTRSGQLRPRLIAYRHRYS